MQINTEIYTLDTQTVRE